LAFARHQFELSQPQEDGSPLLAHLEVAWKASGKKPAMLADAPPIPNGCEQLWGDFLKLHVSRGSTGFGYQRITYADIHAFQSVTGTMLSPWEIGCILEADSIWLSDFAPQPKGDK
jgi:hypothetical protein